MTRIATALHVISRPCLALLLAVATLSPVPVAAAGSAQDAVEPRARLTDNGNLTAIRIRGRIGNNVGVAGFLVYVGGHLVHSGSGERWSIDVPLDHLRRWAEPYASHVPVTLVTTDAQGQRIAALDQRVQLPVGVLGLRNPDRPILLSAN